MDYLVLHIDSEFITGIVFNEDTGKYTALKTEAGDNRYWLYFRIDEFNREISFSPDHKQKVINNTAHFIGDVFKRISQDDSFFYIDRSYTIPELFIESGLLISLKEQYNQACAEPSIKTPLLLTFSDNIPEGAREKFKNFLSQNDFAIVSSQIALAELFSLYVQKSYKSSRFERSQIIFIDALNQNLNLSALSFSDGFFLRSDKEFESHDNMGIDPREKVIVEYVVNEVTRVTKVLNTDARRRDEYRRQNQFAGEWLNRLSMVDKLILDDITIADDRDTKYRVPVDKKKIEQETNRYIKDLVVLFRKFKDKVYRNAPQIVILLGDTLGNSLLGSRFEDEIKREDLFPFITSDINKALAIYPLINLQAYKEKKEKITKVLKGDQTQKKKEPLQTEDSILKKDLEESQREIRVLTEERILLNEKLELLTNQIKLETASKEGTIQGDKDKIKKLIEKIDELQKAVEEAKNNAEKKEREKIEALNTYKVEKENLIATINNLQLINDEIENNSNNEKEKEITEKKQTIITLSGKIGELENLIVDEKKEASRREKEKEDLILQQKRELKDLHDKVSNLEVEESKSNKSGYNETDNNLKEEVNRLTGHLKDSISEKEQAIAALNNRITIKDVEIDNLVHENKKLTESLKNLQESDKKTGTDSHSKKECEADREILKRQLTNNEVLLEKNKEQLELKTNEIDQLRKDKIALEDKIKKLNEQFEKLIKGGNPCDEIEKRLKNCEKVNKSLQEKLLVEEKTKKKYIKSSIILFSVLLLSFVVLLVLFLSNKISFADYPIIKIYEFTPKVTKNTTTEYIVNPTIRFKSRTYKNQIIRIKIINLSAGSLILGYYKQLMCKEGNNGPVELGGRQIHDAGRYKIELYLNDENDTIATKDFDIPPPENYSQ